MTEKQTTSMPPGLDAATGKIPVKMTNDYLFRALLQTNSNVLEGLISSLLHLTSTDIRTITITNPIVLGSHIDDKTFILDIKIAMNDDTIINLEMQVINEDNWVDRSLSYLCRNYDHLSKGENYSSTKFIYQIGILDFTLFPEYPEFYATYQFLNPKNLMKYSDKLNLCVLDLTCISLATEEDKSWHLDYWASLFKSTTWEDLKLMAEKNQIMSEAVSSIYTLLQELNVREECEAREEYIRKEKQRCEALEKVQQLTAENSELSEKNSLLLNENLELRSMLAKLQAQLNAIEP